MKETLTGSYAINRVTVERRSNRFLTGIRGVLGISDEFKVYTVDFSRNGRNSRLGEYSKIKKAARKIGVHAFVQNEGVIDPISFNYEPDENERYDLYSNISRGSTLFD